jgi:hypothetical protein
MSIVRRNAIQTITRLIPDDFLREQLIDLHLGKLTEDQIREIREEREREAEMILQMFPKEEQNKEAGVEKTICLSGYTINGKPETTNSGDSGNQDVVFINEVVKRDTA